MFAPLFATESVTRKSEPGSSHRDSKSCEPSRFGQSPIDDLRKDVYVDISAAKRKKQPFSRDFFSKFLPIQKSCQGCGSGSFDHGFFHFEKNENGVRDLLFGNSENFIDVFLNDFERNPAD